MAFVQVEATYELGHKPRLTAELFARWPDRIAEVLGYDEVRRWLLRGCG